MNEPRYERAFSLIEVVLAVGIVAFVLVGILATFPVGLEAEGASQNESRATQFAAVAFATLHGAPFHEVPFFGQRLDLSQENGGSEAEVALYGCISPRGTVELQSQGAGDALYTLRFAFTPKYLSGRVLGAVVTLEVHRGGGGQAPICFTTMVGNYGS